MYSHRLSQLVAMPRAAGGDRLADQSRLPQGLRDAAVDDPRPIGIEIEEAARDQQQHEDVDR